MVISASVKFFYPLVDFVLPYFPTLKIDLKKAGMKLSQKEFLAQGIFLTIFVFIISLPVFSIIFAYLLKNFLFSFISAITASSLLLVLFFISYVNYPKIIIHQKSKQIDSQISFAVIHLSTLASTKLPLNKIFEIFSSFGEYGEITREINMINNDIKMFGLDVNTAIERAIERSPSKNFTELLWGILSTNLSGGDINIYLKEKARSFIMEYRNKLKDFSHQLSIYLEIYMSAIILGAIFFLILTSIVSGISGAGAQVVFLQFFLIFIFLPLISAIFVYLIKSSSPGGE